MDDMLNAYRIANGMKKKDSYERVVSSPVPQSYYDALEGDTSAQEYSYKRDARNQMDDMVNAYRREHAYTGTIKQDMLRSLTMGPYERGERQTKALGVIYDDETESKMTDFSAISRMHPDIKTSVLADGIKRFLFLLIVALILTIRPLSSYISAYQKAYSTHAAVEGYSSVTGIVKTCEKQISDNGGISYKVTYEYDIGSITYYGVYSVDLRFANRFGINIKHPEGKRIPVYVDEQSNSVSKLADTPSEYPGFYIILIIAFGFIIIIYDIVFIIRCRDGYFYVYKNNGFNKFVKKSNFE